MKLEEYQLMARQQGWHWWYKTKRAYLQVALSRLKLPNHPRLLDLGSGVGANFPVLRQFGKVTGAEQSATARKLSRSLHPEKMNDVDLNKLKLAEQFDVITILDVLYHRNIHNDVDVIHRAFSGLKPNGYLVITDCLHPWLFGPHDVANMARERYTKAELQEKIERAGGKVVRSSHLFCFAFPFFVVGRLLQRVRNRADDDKNSPGMINTFFSLCGVFEAKLLRYTDLPLGSSLLIVAQKK